MPRTMRIGERPGVGGGAGFVAFATGGSILDYVVREHGMLARLAWASGSSDERSVVFQRAPARRPITYSYARGLRASLDGTLRSEGAAPIGIPKDM